MWGLQSSLWVLVALMLGFDTAALQFDEPKDLAFGQAMQVLLKGSGLVFSGWVQETHSNRGALMHFL